MCVSQYTIHLLIHNTTLLHVCCYDYIYTQHQNIMLHLANYRTVPSYMCVAIRSILLHNMCQYDHNIHLLITGLPLYMCVAMTTHKIIFVYMCSVGQDSRVKD